MSLTEMSQVLPSRHFFLGFVKVHILHHASREPIYGAWFLEELARHGNYQMSAGTLYPLFHELESTGLLKREDRVVEGKVRKYYVITPLGERALGVARERIRELVDEIMEDDGAVHRAPSLPGRLAAPPRLPLTQ